MNKDLKNKELIKEMMKTGYPIQLRAGNYFEKRGWNTKHNRYYLDKDEQKGREIDILAFQRYRDEKNNLDVEFHVVAEVKQSIKRPWIIFSTQTKSFEFLEGYSRMHYKINLKLTEPLTGKDIEKESGFLSYNRIGRLYWEGYKRENEPSNIFRALTEAVKAAEHCLQENEEAAKVRRSAEEKVIHFLEPIVIFNGKLYEAFLNENDVIELNEVTKILISFGYISSIYKRYNYGVQIITFSELQNYILQKEKWLQNLKQMITERL